eukprot:775996-Prymnesium_polylepis.1
MRGDAGDAAVTSALALLKGDALELLDLRGNASPSVDAKAAFDGAKREGLTLLLPGDSGDGEALDARHIWFEWRAER